MSSCRPVFPEPQHIVYGTEQINLAERGVLRCYIALSPDASHYETLAAQVIRDAIGQQLGEWPEIHNCDCLYQHPNTNATGEPLNRNNLIPIIVGEAARPWLSQSPAPQPPANLGGIAAAQARSECYTIQIMPDIIALRGTGNQGTLYAAYTLAQLLTMADENLTIPTMTVQDGPGMAWRGLYVESKWGPDLMTLTDWQNLIDHMAALKLNLLTVGIYGTWEIQYHNQITEFLMVPVANHPDLRTAKTLRYFSPQKGGWYEHTYLPKMFADDFFGTVVAYGQSKNVTVRPHFNCLGHNTLIPRLYPELSAQDENGWSTGYGFCLSNPKTLAFMRKTLVSIAERYLLPHGVDSFHLGMDEVYAIKGVYPHHPQQKVSPWCSCSACRQKGQAELVTNYVLDLALTLKAVGINHITIWHDQFAAMGLLNAEFAERVSALGLTDNLIIDWWRYSNQPFDTIHPELGLRRFVTPMTGYYFWSPLRSHYQNIEGMCRMGVQQGAEGTEAYCTHDPAFEGYQRFLADCAWNMSAVKSGDEWLDKLATHIFGPNCTEGAQALHDFNTFFIASSVQQLLFNLDHYRYTYVDVSRPYPRSYPDEALAWLVNAPGMREHLAEAIHWAARVRATLEPWSMASIPRADLVAVWLMEIQRAEGLLRIFSLLLEAYVAMPAVEHTHEHVSDRDHQQQAVITALQKALEILDEVALCIERNKAPYLVPQTLRDWSFMRPYITSALAAKRR